MRYDGWELVNVPDKSYCEAGDILVQSGEEGMPGAYTCLNLLNKKVQALNSKAIVSGHKQGFWVLRKCTEPEMNEFGEVCP